MLHTKPKRSKNLKKYSKATLLSGASLLLTGCLDLGDDSDATIYGTDGDDIMTGTNNDNKFLGSLGADMIDGRGGRDTATYEDSPSAVQIDLLGNVGKGGYAEGDTLVNIEELRGSNYNDTLVGNEKVNFIKGGSGADIINAKGGDDFITGGAGADIINGGDGIDHISYYDSKSAVEINLITGLGKGGDAEGDTFINIENIQGSSYDDILIGDGNDNQIYSRGGNDSISIKGNDIVSGGEGIDKIIFDDGYVVSDIDILKNDNKIIITVKNSDNSMDTVTLDSTETYEIVNGNNIQSVDIKTIWGDLSAADQADFNNNEVDFLSWLGNDNGYNYEGL
ncbi:MAG: hypothetical protein HRU28_08045 [Rhizobiales bacterium]|nr:hypothetical protein [Hyphomicrobiales bacterium]